MNTQTRNEPIICILGRKATFSLIKPRGVLFAQANFLEPQVLGSMRVMDGKEIHLIFLLLISKGRIWFKGTNTFKSTEKKSIYFLHILKFKNNLNIYFPTASYVKGLMKTGVGGSACSACNGNY